MRHLRSRVGLIIASTLVGASLAVPGTATATVTPTSHTTNIASVQAQAASKAASGTSDKDAEEAGKWIGYTVAALAIATVLTVVIGILRTIIFQITHA